MALWLSAPTRWSAPHGTSSHWALLTISSLMPWAMEVTVVMTSCHCHTPFLFPSPCPHICQLTFLHHLFIWPRGGELHFLLGLWLMHLTFLIFWTDSISLANRGIESVLRALLPIPLLLLSKWDPQVLVHAFLLFREADFTASHQHPVPFLRTWWTLVELGRSLLNLWPHSYVFFLPQHLAGIPGILLPEEE